MPLGSLSQLALRLIQCTTAEPAQPSQTPYEPVQRTVEAAAVPELCVAGCMLAQQLAQTCGKLFTPYVSRFLNAITYQLDQSNISSTQRKHLFTTITPLLTFTHTAASSQSYTRLASHLVKALAPLLPPSSRSGEPQNEKEGERKGKKRARYEADELFTASPSSSSPSFPNKELCTSALGALQPLLPTLPLPIRDSIHRILLTMLLHVPRTNQDYALAEHLARVYAACLGEGASASGMLGVSVRAIQAVASAGDVQRTLHRFLHPRVPPNSGSGPSVDDLVLFWKDEEDDEAKEFRKGAGVVTAVELAKASGESLREVEMVDAPSTQTASTPAISNERPSAAAVLRTALPGFASPVLPPNTSSSMFQSIPVPAASTLSGAQSISASAQTESTLSSTNLGSETSKAASSSILPTSAYGSSKPLVTQSVPPQAGPPSIRSPLPTYDDDDDEPIPQIDLASDTDEDET
ncbi:hypothetical protein FRC10_002487 [Ceratobasidium sp. 414]|nr:hypothetical protein FRC10_002487 [Ceratobasidium sp. 414]